MPILYIFYSFDIRANSSRQPLAGTAAVITYCTKMQVSQHQYSGVIVRFFYLFCCHLQNWTDTYFVIPWHFINDCLRGNCCNSSMKRKCLLTHFCTKVHIIACNAIVAYKFPNSYKHVEISFMADFLSIQYRWLDNIKSCDGDMINKHGNWNITFYKVTSFSFISSSAFSDFWYIEQYKGQCSGFCSHAGALY